MRGGNDKNGTIHLYRRGNGIDGVVHKIEHDLLQLNPITMQIRQVGGRVEIDANMPRGCFRLGQSHCLLEHVPRVDRARSEERRVGEEGRSRWSPYPLKKKKTKAERRSHFVEKQQI